ncbi:unnamed protein product [Allacma fusca]|uniref:Uncharacterized protein n=1 Tax=Allacma fusca TaxID=39272 RepID=A0A8J2L6X6_9HEXA|nr:unnamed protein product [Allacma fusca]
MFSAPSEGLKQPRMNLSMREIATVFLSRAGVTITFVWTIIAAAFGGKIHIYQFLPISLKNPLTFFLLWIQEHIMLQYKMVCFNMTITQFLMFFESVSERLALESASLRCPSRDEPCFRTLFKNCRRTQLLISIFNIAFGKAITAGNCGSIFNTNWDINSACMDCCSSGCLEQIPNVPVPSKSSPEPPDVLPALDS